MKKYTIAIAGTTQRTTLCAQVLEKSNQFEIAWILTPKAKAAGRDQLVVPNPLDSFAKKHSVPTIYIDTKIDDLVKEEVLEEVEPDFLLVVDFGYLVPNWLLELPKAASLNIHPSELPKWRGSSPGQFSILFNDKKSAVTLMVINKKLDQGPVIHQDFFDVDRAWTQEDYYSRAFELICDGLDEKIAKFAKNPSIAKPQPEKSPTITAKMLRKDMTFVEWKVVKAAMEGGENEVGGSGDNFGADKGANTDTNKRNNKLPSSKLLLAALEHNKSLALALERASKAFNPWPNLWTLIPTAKGEKRMKLLELEVRAGDSSEPEPSIKKLVLKTVHIEGKNPALWSEIKQNYI